MIRWVCVVGVVLGLACVADQRRETFETQWQETKDRQWRAKVAKMPCPKQCRAKFMDCRKYVEDERSRLALADRFQAAGDGVARALTRSEQDDLSEREEDRREDRSEFKRDLWRAESIEECEYRYGDCVTFCE